MKKHSRIHVSKDKHPVKHSADSPDGSIGAVASGAAAGLTVGAAAGIIGGLPGIAIGAAIGSLAGGVASEVAVETIKSQEEHSSPPKSRQEHQR